MEALLRLRRLERVSDALRGELKDLRELIALNPSKALNPIRTILEGTLKTLCAAQGVRVERRPNLTRMIDKLESEGVIPPSIAVFAHGIRTNTNIGSHHHSEAVTAAHLELS